MSFIIFFIVLPSLIAAIFAYEMTKYNINRNYTENYLAATVEDIESGISIISSQLTNYTLQFLGYEDINKILANKSYSYNEMEYALAPYFDNIFENDSYIECIDFIFPDGKQYSFYKSDYIPHIIDEQALKKLSNRKFLVSYIKSNDTLYYSFSRQLYRYTNSQHIGDIIFYINKDAITSLLSAADSSDVKVFISSDKKIIAHTDIDYIGATLYLPEIISEGKTGAPLSSNGYTVSEFKVNNSSIYNHLTITGIVSNKVLLGNMNKILTILLFLLFVTTAMAILFAGIISHNMTYRIKFLENQMKRYISEHKNFKPIAPSNEIASLEVSFNTLANEISDLLVNLEEEKRKQIKAEITALQSQINPHFIYNALDAISWKAKRNRQYEIDDMIITLATFFRTGLHKGDDVVSIEDEIANVNSYLNIEKIRFPDLFKVQYNIDPEILRYETVKIVLQPLVENSIKHGFKTLKNKQGLLIINGRKDNDDIIFEIIDNGCGLNCNPLSNNSDHDGYGVKNVNQRLRLYYGENYGLSYSDNPDGHGTMVTVRIKAVPIKS
jgi:two-component system sensor histidine kinase YesM